MSSPSAAGTQPGQGLKCPRCDSPNTKFCYYNNYSLSQPRHFCKTCRRYWTRGGVLRNVPVGGGCRKNKKSKSPASSRIAFNPIETFAAAPPAAAMAPTCAFGFNGNSHSSIASSIESLSSVNQELHWKLQQQRLQAVYFGGEGQNESCVSTSSLTTQQPGPLSFVATDHTMPAAAWFPETTSYFLLPNTTSTSATNTTTTYNNINNNSSSSSSNNNNNSGNWNGIPGWIDMPQFTTLLP